MESILIVDDSSVNRRLVADILMEAWPECEILTAPNGRIGLSIALSRPPTIILLDWEMPEMDGIEMLKALRINSTTKEIQVIMLTGVHTSAENLGTAFDAGANEFLRKPVHKIELIARIQSIQLQLRYFEEKTRTELLNKQLIIAAREQELQIKKNELTSLTLILEQRDNFLKETMQRLEALGVVETNAAKDLRNCIHAIKMELGSGQNWEAIKARMNGIHADFLALLTDKHPSLTKNELKLCSLMKLNLSTKETAQILHISPGGVEKRRYRLRKKFGLDSGAKIENYLHSLSQ